MTKKLRVEKRDEKAAGVFIYIFFVCFWFMKAIHVGLFAHSWLLKHCFTEGDALKAKEENSLHRQDASSSLPCADATLGRKTQQQGSETKRQST